MRLLVNFREKSCIWLNWFAAQKQTSTFRCQKNGKWYKIWKNQTGRKTYISIICRLRVKVQAKILQSNPKHNSLSYSNFLLLRNPKWSQLEAFSVAILVSLSLGAFSLFMNFSVKTGNLFCCTDLLRISKLVHSDAKKWFVLVDGAKLPFYPWLATLLAMV